MNSIQKTAYDFYLDYINNYLTMESISEAYEITEELAFALYDEGKGIQKAINENKAID